MAWSGISVIIPVYNVREYLGKCVDSVISQTFKDLEIILVDDGSTDGSGELCDEIQKKDSRVNVIHQKNQGLAVARNVGLDIAKGEWIAFLDSDDWIQPEMYEELINLANSYTAEIVSCATHRCESEDVPIPNLDNKIVVMNESQIVKELISTEILRFEVWNKLWKKTLIDDVRFIPKQVSEDVHFDRILFSRVDKIVHINKVMHNYRVNRPGSTNTYFRINRLCIFDEFDKWYDDLIKKNKNELASNIAVIAAQFAIHIYEETIEKDVEYEVRELLISAFRKNNERAKKRGNYYGFYSVKASVMAFSPKLYSCLWHLRLHFA